MMIVEIGVAARSLTSERGVEGTRRVSAVGAGMEKWTERRDETTAAIGPGRLG
ncbi:hypothetical protein DPMN_136634 [Dreissena polymorpha]|uniref:Uncharacterized protein n=1 Tax=Dreissena polymorpha TaxID=45954 RepID=A0A9D4JCU4_DREPO|nr:hypothetical protein DPMN_136634 [Dreissena polymorpha]